MNSDGNLGNGNSINQSVPVRCGGVSNIKEVLVSGHPYSITAIQEDGTLWVWGWNGTGQLGLGDTTKRETPIKHPSVENVSKAMISCGYGPDGNNPAGHGVALQTDGTLLVSGFNGEGQLGLGDTTQRNSFTPLKLDGEVMDVFGGDGRYASVGVLTKQGELYLWGYNGYGQLGTGNTERQLTPFKPKAPFQGRVSRATFGGGGSYEGCIVQAGDAPLAGNELWAAGYGAQGNLGIGTFNRINSTFQRVLGQSGVIEEWGVFGQGASHWGLGVLYNDGHVDACGANSSFGETGTQVANLQNVAALANVIF